MFGQNWYTVRGLSETAYRICQQITHKSKGKHDLNSNYKNILCNDSRYIYSIPTAV